MEKIIISVGGESNTFNPGNTPAPIIARNIVDFLTANGFDGIDFDLESIGNSIASPNPGQYLADLIVNLRMLMPSIFVTCAP